MTILTIVSTNKNLFLTVHNKNKIIYSKSLGCFKMDFKDLKIPNNVNKIVKNLLDFLIKNGINWIHLRFVGCSKLFLLRNLSKQFKKKIFYSSTNFLNKQPFNGVKRKKIRRI